MDIVIIFIVLIVCIIVLIKIDMRDKKMANILKKSKQDMIDLESITKNIERDYKPEIVKLSTYEQEQENSAIISYDELIKSTETNKIAYDDNYKNEETIEIKKINMQNTNGPIVQDSKINVILMNYEKEEAFLKALKQLQIDLAR